MTAPPAILLNEAQAKAYLGGVDPERVAPPLRFGRCKRWARWALDEAVMRAAGLKVQRNPKTAFDAWHESET